VLSGRSWVRIGVDHFVSFFSNIGTLILRKSWKRVAILGPDGQRGGGKLTFSDLAAFRTL
jgi:hypothetical protein